MKKFIAIAIAAVLAAPSYAQTYSSMLAGSDPESFAVGNASVARPAGIHAAGVNAAAMSLSDRKMYAGAAFSMWAPRMAGAKIVDIGAWGKINDKLAIGLDARYAIGKTYDATNDMGAVTGRFTPGDIQAALGVSYTIIDGLSAGVAARIASSSIAENMSGLAFGADVSLAYCKDGLGAAIAISNLGSSMNYGGKNTLPMPAMIKAGAAYSVAGLTASAEADYLFDGAFMAGLGLEYDIKEMVFVRAGYHYGDQKKALVSFASAGVGLKYAGVELNACYLFASKALGNTVMIGLGYSF